MTRCCRFTCVLIVLGLFTTTALIAAAGDQAKALKYQFKSGETYIYAVTIIAETPDATETSKGTIQLVVKAADATSMQMTPTVSLPKQIKSKPGKGFKGVGLKGSTGQLFFGTREVTIDSYGKVIKSAGETPLPYLLGPAGELVLEPLSPKGEKGWKREKDLVIREVQRTAFGAPGRANETNTPAKEVVTCEIVAAAGSSVQLKKTYELKTVAAEGSEARIQFQGTGEFTFDTQAGLMKAGEFTGSIVLSEKNVTVRIPLTYSYRLMDAAEAAAAKKEQEERRAKSAEAAKEAAVLKPLADPDITSALADLKSTNRLTSQKAADRLAKAIPVENRREEVAAQLAGSIKDALSRLHISKALKVWGTDKSVAPLLKNQDWVVRMDACKILAEVGTKESLPALQAAQSDSNRSVVNEATKAIKSIEARK